MSGEESPGESCPPNDERFPTDKHPNDERPNDESALQTKKSLQKRPGTPTSQPSYLNTTSVSGRATQGNTSPSAFSSRVSPGHSISYAIDPFSNRQRQVRHVPLRHDDRIGNAQRLGVEMRRRELGLTAAVLDVRSGVLGEELDLR